MTHERSEIKKIVRPWDRGRHAGLAALCLTHLALGPVWAEERGLTVPAAISDSVAVPAPLTPTGRVLQVPKAQNVLEGQMKKDRPITIRADEVTYQGRQKLNTWRGHVVLKHGPTTLHADKMVASANRDSAIAQGHIDLTDREEKIRLTSQSLEYKNRLKNITASGSPFFTMTDTQGSETTIQGDTMEIQSEDKTAQADGSVIIKRKDITANSDQAHYFDSDQRVELTGHPKIIKGPNVFTGQKITAYFKQGRILLEGSVHATIYPEEFSDKKN